jgi:hypothetical protein
MGTCGQTILSLDNAHLYGGQEPPIARRLRGELTGGPGFSWADLKPAETSASCHRRGETNGEEVQRSPFGSGTIRWGQQTRRRETRDEGEIYSRETELITILRPCCINHYTTLLNQSRHALFRVRT